MKTLAILFTLFYFLNALAVAPYGIKGQNQSVTYPNVYQYPNYSVTGLGGINALIETGNKNILENPSYEAPFFGSAPPSWASLGMTFNTSALPLSGQKAVRVSMSSSAMAFFQDSGVSQAAFAGGIQCLAMVYVKTTVSGIFVSSRQNSVTSTSNRVAVNNDGKYGLYKVPFICGSGSNGISIHSNGVAVTGDVDVDDAFVGAVDLKQDINNIGPWTDAGATTITATTSNPTKGTSSLDKIRWRQVGDSMEIRVEYVQSGAGLAGSGDYLLQIPSGYSIDSSKVTFDTAVEGGSSDYTLNNGLGTASLNVTGNGFLGTVVAYDSTRVRVLGLSVASSIPGNSTGAWGSSFYDLSSASTNLVAVFTVPITKFSSATSVYTSNNANYSPRAFTPTVTYGAGGATNVAWTGTESRNGNKLIVDIKGTFSGLSASFTTPKFTIPNNLVVDTSSILIGANGFKVVGYGAVEDAGIANYQLFATSLNSTQVTVDLFNAAGTYTNNANIQNTVPTTFNNLDTITLHYEVPILGWENSNIIIGQFNGLQTCTDTLACTDTFSARISSTGVVTSENANWINGNCTLSATSSYTCPLATSLTVPMACTVTQEENTGGTILFNNMVFPQVSNVLVVLYTASSRAPYNFNLICQKQGADYIGKTAMAVASDQNVRSTGSTSVDTQSVYFGSGADCETACSTGSCAICHRTGTRITSVTYVAAGIYALNGLDGTKWNCLGTANNGSAYVAVTHPRQSSTSSYVLLETQGNIRRASIQCIGIP